MRPGRVGWVFHTDIVEVTQDDGRTWGVKEARDPVLRKWGRVTRVQK